MRNNLLRAPKLTSSLLNKKGKEPMLEPGFPPPSLVATADKRYVNRYHYNTLTDEWFLVIDAKIIDNINHWVIRVVDPEDGRPIGHLQKSTMDIWANRFADRPFDLEAHASGELETLYEWFRYSVCSHISDKAKVQELFDGYMTRLNYCSSFEALVRLGLRQP